MTGIDISPTACHVMAKRLRMSAARNPGQAGGGEAGLNK
jgi:hypothetical protein